MSALSMADLILLVLYLALLPYFAFNLVTALAALAWGRVSRKARGSSGLEEAPRRRFLVVVPAHDEEEGIAGTVRSCVALDYPASLFEVLVIADNCTDQTASRAKEAGARVIERSDMTRKSKGFAIEYLLERLRETGEFDGLDALVVVDADSTVHPDLLRVFARGLDAGHDWIQCFDTVGNADASWRTRLMAYAFSLINGVTLQGLSSLGLSAGLRGNGMCLSTRGLGRVPWCTHGLTEDLEYSWSVRIAGGYIAFDRDAAVYATMLSRGGPASVSQRRRWESGRRELRSKMLWPLLGSTHLRPVEKLAALIELTMPTTVSLCAAYLGLSLFAAWRLPAILSQHGIAYLILLAMCQTIATLGLALQFASPFLLSFLPWRFALSLLHFPHYAIWKLVVALKPRPRSWVRTMREPIVDGTESQRGNRSPKLRARVTPADTSTHNSSENRSG